MTSLLALITVVKHKSIHAKQLVKCKVLETSVKCLPFESSETSAKRAVALAIYRSP